jgi:hypothetical protein
VDGIYENVLLFYLKREVRNAVKGGGSEKKVICFLNEWCKCVEKDDLVDLHFSVFPSILAKIYKKLNEKEYFSVKETYLFIRENLCSEFRFFVFDILKMIEDYFDGNIYGLDFYIKEYELMGM